MRAMATNVRVTAKNVRGVPPELLSAHGLRSRGVGRRRALLGGALASALLLVCAPPNAWAQQARRQAAAAGTANTIRPPPNAQGQAPFDLTGYWVSLVTENWRFRMVAPGSGDYAGIPINLKGKQFADAWQPAADIAAGKQCEAYGAPSVMQIPERLHIVWQDDQTLRVDTDQGMQTRLLHFGRAPAAADMPPSLQGYSRARWVPFRIANPFGAQANAQRYGSLVVVTDELQPGLLRKNGVPYSADTKMTAYWKTHAEGDEQWLLISIKVEDPEYLSGPYVYDSIFQKEADGAKWNPGACSLTS
jgi:hypothetical protein